MFKFVLNTKGAVLPDDKLFYLVGNNGIFKVVRNAYYSVVVKEEKPATLEKVEEIAEFNIPKLPLAIMEQAETFFESVYKKHKSEAIILLALSMVDKKWVPIIPLQEVKYGSLHVSYKVPDIHANPINLPEHYKIFGSIHSHANASAFHSGTDDGDELNSDGFHAVIGNLDKPERTYSSRFMIMGTEFQGLLRDWVDRPEVHRHDERWMECVSIAQPPAPTYHNNTTGFKTRHNEWADNLVSASKAVAAPSEAQSALALVPVGGVRVDKRSPEAKALDKIIDSHYGPDPEEQTEQEKLDEEAQEARDMLSWDEPPMAEREETLARGAAHLRDILSLFEVFGNLTDNDEKLLLLAAHVRDSDHTVGG